MKSTIKSFGEFKQQLETNTDLQTKFKENPVEAIQQFEQTDPVYTRDKVVYRIVVLVLGLIIICIVGGVIILMSSKTTPDIDKLVPTMLTATCSAALGALTGLLAPSPRTNT
jgi:hypothetical protein